MSWGKWTLGGNAFLGHFKPITESFHRPFFGIVAQMAVLDDVAFV
jgi:hypothetical protein